MRRTSNRIQPLAQCEQCGEMQPSADMHGHVCERCRSAAQWLRGTIIVLVLLVFIHFAALAQAAEPLPQWQAYTEEIAEDMGIKGVFLVVQYKFTNRHQKGQARIGVGAGNRFVVLLGDRYLRRAQPREVRETVRHELCHIKAYLRYGTVKRANRFHHHGWVDCARRWDVSLVGFVND